MKKSTIAILALPAILMASCSSDEPAVDSGADGNVTFVAQLPGNFASRAYADGAKATELTYAVYESGSNTPVLTSKDPSAPQATFSGLQAKLTLNLVKGKTYDVVFWADQADAPYEFNASDKSITINYDGIKSGDENRDAFFSVEKQLTVNGAIQRTVTLRRPFAQINFGTNDLAQAEAVGTKVAKTQLTVEGAYKKLNLFDGTASVPVNVVYEYNALPVGEIFPVDGYTYLSMNYVLTGNRPGDPNVQTADKELVNCVFEMQDNNGKGINTLTLSNVPVQRNYRTNVYGSLLTSQVDYFIEIHPDFETPDHTLSQLVLASQIGGSVVLDADVELPSSGESADGPQNYLTVASGKQMVIDLNGHIIAGGIKVNGELVIKGDGSVLPVTGTATHCIVAAPGGKVTIEGGTYVACTDINDATNSAIYSQGGNVVIKGGHFSATKDYNGKWYVLNLKNGSNGDIKAYGGTFDYQDPAKGDDYKGGNFVAPGYSSIGEEVNGKIVYNVAKNQPVKNAEQLKSVLEQGGDVVVAELFDITEDTELVVNGTLSSNLQGRIGLKNGAKVTVKGNGTIKTGADAYGIFNVYDAELTVEDITIEHANKLDGSPIGLRDGNGSITLKGVTIDSDFGTVCSWATSQGTITATDCTFKSTSNSARNGRNWTYTVLINGDVDAVFDNCTVVGVQGGISSSTDSRLTINGGTYTTTKYPDEPNAQAFYAVYVAQGGMATINGGNFCSYDKADIFNGNNDHPGDPLGKFVLKGGNFCNQGFTQGTGGIIEPAPGYEWKPLTGNDPYKWTVVKK